MKVIFSTLFSILVISTNAQSSFFKKQKIILRPILGYDFSLNTVKANAITDYQNNINTDGISFPALSVTFIIKNNFGLEASVYGIWDTKAKKNQRLFDQQFNSKFAAQYYISEDTLHYNLSEPFSRFAGTFGIVYRIEKNRWVCIPKVFVGATTVTLSSQSRYLKEKDGNNVLRTYYGSWSTSKDVFVLGTGISFIYRLNKRIGVCFDAAISCNNPRLNFTEDIRNLVSEETTNTSYRYHKFQYRINTGIGVAIGF